MKCEKQNGCEFATLAAAQVADSATSSNGKVVRDAVEAMIARFESAEKSSLRNLATAMIEVGRFFGIPDDHVASAPILAIIQGYGTKSSISHKDVMRLLAIDMVMPISGDDQVTNRILTEAGPLAERLSHRLHHVDRLLPPISTGSPESMRKWWIRFQAKLAEHRNVDLIDIDSGKMRQSAMPEILAPYLHQRAPKGRPRN